MPENSHSSVEGRYQQLLIAIQELSSKMNLEEILDYIVHAASDLCDAQAAWILFPDQTERNLTLETGSFNNIAQYKGRSTVLETSLEGWVASNQQPMIVNDVNLYDGSNGNIIHLPDIEINSLLILPVTNKDRYIGVLEVVNKRSGDFIQLDQEILSALVSQATICLDNTIHFLQSDLVPELVHELRTPLAALNTALYLLQRSDLSEDRREQIFQMIHSEFIRLSEMTTSFLDYSRLKYGKMKFEFIRFDLTQLIIESVEVIQTQLDEKGLNLVLDLPADPLFITADKYKIKQVILNLLNNALKYNNVGCNIHLKAKATPPEVSFSVQDNGQGIPAGYLPRLFERFYRIPEIERQTQGTGLGLTICKQIVEAHKGKIDVSSSLGQGSTFTVHLPITQDPRQLLD